MFWTILRPTYELLEAETTLDPTPPWFRYLDVSHSQHVVASRRDMSIRDWFCMGPSTCVESVKAALGIRALWVRTPLQLYNYIAARDCVITN